MYKNKNREEMIIIIINTKYTYKLLDNESHHKLIMTLTVKNYDLKHKCLMWSYTYTYLRKNGILNFSRKKITG